MKLPDKTLNSCCDAVMSKRSEAVIFDMDGLLFNSEALYWDAILRAVSELGRAFEVNDFLKLIGRPWSENRLILQEHLGPSRDVEAFRTSWMRHYGGMKAAL